MAGFEGLLKGIDRFDPELGNKLSTYATWWIKQAILRELDRHSTTIRLPGYVRGLRRQVIRMEEERGKKLTASDIREEFGVTEEVARAARKTRATASLDASLSRAEPGSLKKLVENSKAEEPATESVKERKSEALREAMKDRLSDRERRVIKLYYGFEDYKPRTLEEVGEVFKLSRERIRQLRDRALDKLRQAGDLESLWKGDPDS